MKILENKKGFSDMIVITIISGILGSLFILGIFVWKEIEVLKVLDYQRSIIKYISNSDKALGDYTLINTSKIFDIADRQVENCGNNICDLAEKWNCPQDCPIDSLVDPGIIPCPFRESKNCMDDDYCKIVTLPNCPICSAVREFCVSKNDYPENKFDCYASGGQWEQDAYQPYCLLQYPDANYYCLSGEDCLSQFCVADVPVNPGRKSSYEGMKADGYCFSRNDKRGCFTTIDKGRVGYSICID
ncbi:MAG: hypothetical protein WCS88_04790 [Patescibacteria group bacterium]|jgi:hypothetical protein